MFAVTHPDFQCHRSKFWPCNSDDSHPYSPGSSSPPHRVFWLVLGAVANIFLLSVHGKTFPIGASTTDEKLELALHVQQLARLVERQETLVFAAENYLNKQRQSLGSEDRCFDWPDTLHDPLPSSIGRHLEER